MIPAFKLLTYALVAVLGLGAAGGGVALASEDSLPGQVLYPVKLVVEDLRIAMGSSSEAKAEQSLSFLDSRLGEIEALNKQQSGIPEGVVARMTQQMEQTLTRIADSRPDDVPALLARFQEQLRLQQETLEGLKAGGPDSGQPGLEEALEATHRLRRMVDSAQDDPTEFQKQHKQGQDQSPDPQGEPGGDCVDCDPVQDQDRDRTRDQDQENAPEDAPQNQEQNQHEYQEPQGEPGAQGGGDPPQEQNKNQTGVGEAVEAPGSSRAPGP